MEEEIKGKGFVIKDRRSFDEKGDVRKPDEQTGAQKEQKPEEKAGERKEEKPRQPEDKKAEKKTPRQPQSLPPLSFSDFMVSLSTTVMYHFGDLADPASSKDRA